MPEAPQPIETIETQEAVESKESLSVSDQVEQGQKELMADVNHTIGRTIQLSGSLEMNEGLRLKGMGNLLKYVNARAALRIRGIERLETAVGIQQKIGNIFKITLGQEIAAEGTTARLGKTKFEISTQPGVILGMEKYQGADKTKFYLGYTYKEDGFKVTFLGELTEEQQIDENDKILEESTVSARLKLNQQLSSHTSVFADVTLSNINQPDNLGIDDLKAYLGFNINLEKDQAIAMSFDPKNQAGNISFVGHF